MVADVPKEAGKGKGETAPEPVAEPASSPRLPTGRHGLPREFIVENQRERIIAAMVDTVAEHGYNATTVGHITKAASVSRRTFYERFPGKEACFLAAYEMVTDHIRDAMKVAAEAFEDWPQQVRAALATVLRFLAAEPELARVCMIEPIAAGGEIAERHRESMQGLGEVLKASRSQRTGERSRPEATEATLVGGIVSLIVREIDAGRTEKLEALLPDLVELTLAPYLGAGEAARQARAS